MTATPCEVPLNSARVKTDPKLVPCKRCGAAPWIIQGFLDYGCQVYCRCEDQPTVFEDCWADAAELWNMGHAGSPDSPALSWRPPSHVPFDSLAALAATRRSAAKPTLEIRAAVACVALAALVALHEEGVSMVMASTTELLIGAVAVTAFRLWPGRNAK